MRLGNGKWENTIFNSRLQPTQIGLGNGVNSQNLLKLEYSYGTTANNGNVVEQKITVPGVTYPYIQAYTYDDLNRLATATETKNSVQEWKQTFTYDRYGNRNFNTSGSNTTTLPESFDPDIYNPTISTTNNRFDSGQGYSYDESGNTTADAEGRTFVYDAENKQVEVIQSSTTIGEYFYDGDGKRVKKIAGSEETIFVYDAGGRLIGEYSSIVQTGSNAKTVYTTNDHLGSPRINTDGAGAVISRHDYHPFGEEIARTGYGSDTIRKQFTGYERDGETGLDFAQARYFAGTLGRFVSPDSFANDTHVHDPASWNLYAYVRNNPLRYVDPTGEEIWVVFEEEEEYEENGEKKTRRVTRSLQYRDGKLWSNYGKSVEYAGTNATALKIRDDLNEIRNQSRSAREGIDELASNKLRHTIGHKDYGQNASIRGDTNYTDIDAVANGRPSGSNTIYDSKLPEIKGESTAFTLARELLGPATNIAAGAHYPFDHWIWESDPGTNYTKAEYDRMRYHRIVRQLFYPGNPRELGGRTLPTGRVVCRWNTQLGEGPEKCSFDQP